MGPRLVALALGAAAAGAGCSLTFDGEAPDVTLLDAPTAPLVGPRPAIADDEFFWPVRAPDGRWWALLYALESDSLGGTQTVGAFAPREPLDGLGSTIARMRVARLDGDRFEAAVADPVVRWAGGQLYHRSVGAGATVTVWRPGAPWPGATYAGPTGRADFTFADRAFALDDDAATWVYRSDGTHARTLAGERPLLFERGGDLLVGMRDCAMRPGQDACTHLVAHDTADDGDVDLGRIRTAMDPSSIVFTDDVRMILCDDLGLYSIHFDGSGIRTVDHARCNGNALRLTSELILCNAAGLRRVRLTNGAEDVIDARPCLGSLVRLGRPPSWSVTRPDDGTLFVYTPLGLLVAPGDGSLPRLGGDCGHEESALGSLPAELLDEAMLLCDGRGLCRVPYDGGPTVTIDAEPCELLRTGEWLTDDEPPRLARGDAWYTREPIATFPSLLEHDVWAAPLDGSAPPRVVLAADGANLYLPTGAPTTREPLHAREPPSPDAWVRGSNGWLGDWQFMERGILAWPSSDGARVRWLEHAARLDPVGDLLSAAPGGAPLKIARNVALYAEVAPGRLVVADDQAFVGAQNRVLLVDEDQRVARRLVVGADAFARVDAATLAVELVADADQRALALVALPDRVR